MGKPPRILKAHRAERLRREREERERLAKECGAEIQRVWHSMALGSIEMIWKSNEKHGIPFDTP